MISFFEVIIIFVVEWATIFVRPRMWNVFNNSREIHTKQIKLILLSQFLNMLLYFLLFGKNFERVFDNHIVHTISILRALLISGIIPSIYYLYLRKKTYNMAREILYTMKSELEEYPSFKHFRNEVIYGHNLSVSVKEIKKIYIQDINLESLRKDI